MKTILFSILSLMLAMVGANAQAMAPYRVGDILEIRVSGIPAEDATTFGTPFTIDDQGMVNIPYINDVKVVGLLPNQIQNLLQDRFKEEKIFTNPTVTVVMNQPRFVNVVGEVRAPQRVTYTADLTLMSAINAAGGFSDYARQSRVSLTRDGKTTIYDVTRIRKNPSTDPKVMPGDQISVPQSIW